MKKKYYFGPWMVLFLGSAILQVCSSYLAFDTSAVDLLAIVFPIVMVGPLYCLYRDRKKWAISGKMIVVLSVAMVVAVGILSFLLHRYLI